MARNMSVGVFGNFQRLKSPTVGSGTGAKGEKGHVMGEVLPTICTNGSTLVLVRQRI